MIFLFSAIHDQGYENVCWAYALSTMLRASIRSAFKKYKIEIDRKLQLKLLSRIDYSLECLTIIKRMEILNNPNHHKMMRKELTMNIFPFGKDGTDPSLIIKLVCLFWKII